MAEELFRPETFKYKMKRRFPTFALLVLVFAVIWLLKDLGVIVIDVPWVPVILIIIALGMIINRFIAT